MEDALFIDGQDDPWAGLNQLARQGGRYVASDREESRMQGTHVSRENKLKW